MEHSPLILRPLHFPHHLTAELPLCKSTLARDLILEANSGTSELRDRLNSDPTLPRDLQVLVDGLRGGVIDCADSGTALRFLTAYHAVHGGRHTFTGSRRLGERPITELLETLRAAGVAITYLEQEGQLPYTIEGKRPLHFPKTINATHWRSSQYLSALLLSGCPSRFVYPEASPSYAYVLLTLQRMQKQGYTVSKNRDSLQITHHSASAHPFGAATPLQRDWSSAAYWYALLALCPEIRTITLPGLYRDSGHPDEAVATLYSHHFGIHTHGTEAILTRSIVVEKTVVADLSQSPDLFLTVACTCLGLRLPFRLSGLTLLPHKESDRIESFLTIATNLGAEGFRRTASTLTWDGTLHPTPSATIDPHEDHRVAMSFGVLLLSGAFAGSYRMLSPQVVGKSYPQFWAQFPSLKHP